MATIIREIETRLSPEAAWNAARDVGALHTRLVKGFVLDVTVEKGARVVRFANGVTVRELILGANDAARRLAWSAQSPSLSHHSASIQVFEGDKGGARLVWTADILPDAAAPVIGQMMDAGAAAIKATLDSAAADAR